MLRRLIAFFASVFALSAVAAAPTPALADRLEDAVKARQGYFQMIKFQVGGLAAMAKGQAPYDATAAKTYADTLAALAALDVAPMFPAGTDNEAMAGKTRSLPKIWSDLPGVMAKQSDFSKAAAGLAASAGDGLDGLRAGIGPVGQACKSCHDAYRAKAF